ncbi:MAG: GIY-YIG nuclease family protein [Eubacteriales bacterium]|nr:GIY-YIG nuclease family protein [Eubacteriales bacterium]
MKEFNIREEVKRLPEVPGVYLMHNSVDEVIYVGKAVNLKARVSQYFHHNENRQNRIYQMIANIQWFETIQVESELEALILESNLIKEYRPRYNAALRDDENHPYLRVDLKEAFPAIRLTTENERDEALYLGPFYKSMEPEKALGFVCKHYGLRTCSKRLDGKLPEGHPCIYHSMGQCMGPCSGSVDELNYRKYLEKAIHFFLSSDGNDIRESLERKMEQAVEELAFERAGQVKKQLTELDEILRKINFSKKENEENTDLFAVAVSEQTAAVVLYLLRKRRLSGRDLFILPLREKDGRSEGQILREFVEKFYQESPYVPGRVILTERIGNKTALEEILSEKKGSRVICSCPRTGESGRFVTLTKEHAQKLLSQKIGGDRD